MDFISKTLSETLWQAGRVFNLGRDMARRRDLKRRRDPLPRRLTNRVGPDDQPGGCLGDSNERDISPLLADSDGDNEVRIEVASTLFNAVKVRVEDVRNGGLGPILPALYTDASWAEFGLVGDVVLRRCKHVTAW